MGVLCLCCGEDIAEDRVKRLLQSEASRHVLPLWTTLFQEELSASGISLDVSELAKNGGRVCRKCFTSLERCSKLLKDVKANIQEAVQCLSQNSSGGRSVTRPFLPPVGCSASASVEGDSPDVLVSVFPLQLFSSNTAML